MKQEMTLQRALFITFSDIYDPYGNGGVKASRKNYELLERCFGEGNVDVCMFLNEMKEDVPKNTTVFLRVHSSLGHLTAALCGCKVYFPWKEKEIKKLIEQKKPDLLFIDSSLLGRLVRGKKNCPTVLFYHNIEADYAWNKVRNEGIHFLPSFWASKYNDRCGTKADRVICLNRRDSDRLSQLYGRKADFLLPISFTDTFDVGRTVEIYEREVLFLGSLFVSNQVSVEWFMQEVLPKLDNISLNIVGMGFEKLKGEYEKNKSVHVTGAVQDLDNCYYKHAAVVLPIRCGAGMKVKTAEAMMYGRQIFASDEALEGYDIEGVEGIVRCNTAEEYAVAINSFFNEGKCRPYMKEVRKAFLEKYETSCLKEGFQQFLENLLEI